MKNLLYNNIIFDDYTIGDEGTWSQICDKCVANNNVDNTELDNSGQGICGVKGCNKESSFYIDFDKTRIKFIDEV